MESGFKRQAVFILNQQGIIAQINSPYSEKDDIYSNNMAIEDSVPEVEISDELDNKKV
jgi:hypothetical protein